MAQTADRAAPQLNVRGALRGFEETAACGGAIAGKRGAFTISEQHPHVDVHTFVVSCIGGMRGNITVTRGHAYVLTATGMKTTNSVDSLPVVIMTIRDSNALVNAAVTPIRCE